MNLYLPPIKLMRKPKIMRKGAKKVIFKAISCAVTAVPMFAPKIIPNDCENDKAPALTNPNVIIVVAVLDWIIEVTIAPEIKPLLGLLVNFFINLLNCSPETLRISWLNCSIPYKNKIIPGKIVKAISNHMILI